MASETDLKYRARYIATTYSANESKIADNIRKRIETMNLQDKVFDVLVPEETIVCRDKKTGNIQKDKDGNDKVKIRPIFKGYIFVQMIMTDDAWYMVRNTPGVTGIVGSSGGGTKPIPVPPDEMEAILKRIGKFDDEMLEKYKIGDTVVVISGPYKDMSGKIISIDKENKTVTFNAIFFGKPSPHEVDFSIIKKL